MSKVGIPAERRAAEATQAGRRAVEGLEPELGLVDDADVAQFGKAVTAAVEGAASNPVAVAGASAQLASDLSRIPLTAYARWLGADVPPVIPPAGKDRRFADPAWSQHPAFFTLHQSYEAVSRFSRTLVDAAGLDRRTRDKARLAVDALLDASAPTNFLATNPAALARAYQTAGASLVRGARNVVDDVLTNGGRARPGGTSPFTGGGNPAATPAKVVYPN